MEHSESFSPKDKKEDASINIRLNRRNHNRYIVKEFAAGGIGTITEISRGGLKIKKINSEEIMDSQLSVSILNNEVKADIVWQNKKYTGLRFADEFDVVQLIKALTKKINEQEIKPKRIVQDNAIAPFAKKDVLSSCINLMAELENTVADLPQLKICVEEISDICKEPDDHDKNITKEKEKIEEIKEPESVEPPDLSELLIYAANTALAGTESKITDVEFAIARLGVDSVKKISTDFLRKKISTIEISLSNFNNYESYNILKTVIFKHLTLFFGYKDERGEGRLLLSLETKGIDILMGLSSEDSKNLKDYYICSPRVYSEISRIYEKNNFGRDLLSINKFYFENRMGMFKDLYAGYILAHLILNPSYTFSNNIKLVLSQRNLIFSFLMYLTVIATQFILDKDRESGVVLVNLLRRAGMDQNKIMDFLSDSLSEANNVLKDLGLSGTIRSGSLPQSSFKIEGYLQRNIHCKYLINSFKDFSVMKSIKRMALRYEDEAYTHFILGKVMTADDIGLNSKVYSVIPCKNISEHELYVEDFSYFDLVIFKDIDRLPVSLLKAFVKLWNGFEGKIIVTFNNLSFLDFDNKDLYLLLKNHIVDFPSYFSNREIYERMIDHTVNYIKPYTGKREIDKTRYFNDVFSMDYIKTSELQSYV